MSDNHYIPLESLPVPIPFIPGGQATVVYDLIRVLDFDYEAVMARFITRAEELNNQQAALDAADPRPEDYAAQRTALQEGHKANNEAGSHYLIEWLVRRVEGINPTPVPGKPDTWAHIHPALRQWLVGTGALSEVYRQVNPSFRPGV